MPRAPFALVAILVLASPALAQVTPVGDPSIDATYVRLGPETEGFLLEPATPGPNADVALVFSHPNRDNYGERPGWYMAQRGYRVLLVNWRGEDGVDDPPPERFLPSISLGIDHMAMLEGVTSVVLLTHSGGGHIGALYQNVAENGPGACSDAAKIVPCDPEGIEALTQADGVIFLDATLGAAHLITAVDPAVREDGTRDPSLDMFAEANGYVPDEGATYDADFVAAYYEAQSARANAIVDEALARLAAIEAGEGSFANDEPFTVNGIGVRAAGARLYQPDLAFQSRTRAPHLLLGVQGEEEVVIESIRPVMARHLRDIGTLGAMNYTGTVRNFLAGAAIRTSPDFAMTEDDIVGVDWASAYDSTPANAEGITVPSLVMTMTCHYLVVPGEIVFNRLASDDKSYVGVQGATHGFEPCQPEYGDTAGRTFDYLDRWLSEEGRF